MAIAKPLLEITEADLQLLKTNGVREDRTLEYKRELPTGQAEDKKAFLEDVTSFANAVGGDLVYGIEAKDGVPVDVCGVASSNPDQEGLRLQNMLRDGVQPRLPHVSIQAVPVPDGKWCYVLRIPNSFAKPHGVDRGGKTKAYSFHSRNSNGIFPLDVSKIRAAFTQSQDAVERVRSFHLGRLNRIVANDLPVQTGEDSRIIFHLIPLAAFTTDTTYDLTQIMRDHQAYQALAYWRQDARFNLDGVLFHSKPYAPGNEDDVRGYVQVFHSGIVEAVDPHGWGGDGPQKIAGDEYDPILVRHLKDLLTVQKALGVDPPVYVNLTLTRMKGWAITLRNGNPVDKRRHEMRGSKIDRDVLVLPDVRIDSFEQRPTAIMRPILNALWNAADWAGSPSYDKEGQWVNPNTSRLGYDWQDQ